MEDVGDECKVVFDRLLLESVAKLSRRGGGGVQQPERLHCKKSLTDDISSAGMPLTKLSLAGNNTIILAQGEFGK